MSEAPDLPFDGTDPAAAGEPAGARWEAEPQPLGVEFTPTGHPEVDAALGRLPALDGVPASAHAAVYEDVHRSLTATLTALDGPDPQDDPPR
ncbi:hypothetical protein ACIGXM_24695 [Kitasatospora sp. NPDC052896]|uniref:hypothetical protein n=1 Tax=Kitasatospora sp. NPDC052896 TaxID=3364061 RepID=UPI0037C8AD5A